MKKMKKLLVLLVALIMVFAMTVPAAAQTVTVGGGEGSITITNASKGQKYSIYKLFDATVSADGKISYKLPAGKTDLTADGKDGATWFRLDSAGNVLTNGGDLTSTDFQAWAAAFATQVGTEQTADGKTVKFDQIPYGYYFVKSGLGAVLSVDSTTPNVEVIDKNTTEPNVPADGGKKIMTAGATNDKKEITAKIGDTVDFEITFEATNFKTGEGNTKQIKRYTIVDTPTGLKINPDSIVVKVEGEMNSITPASKNVDNTNGKMTLVLKWAQDDGATIYQSPARVTVTYSATVTKGAQNGEATNTATITPNYDDPSTPDEPPIPGGETKVKTFKFTLNKVGEGDKPLTGAKFKLFDAQTNGTEIKVVKDGNDYRVAEADETGVEIEAGTVVVKGLKGSTAYWLEETQAPDGYNKLTAREKVTLGADNTVATEAKVVNQAGAELPSTGGIGTTIFYVLGAILVAGAGVVLTVRRRMNKH